MQADHEIEERLIIEIHIETPKEGERYGNKRTIFTFDEPRHGFNITKLALNILELCSNPDIR
jgi:hypothetical protein